MATLGIVGILGDHDSAQAARRLAAMAAAPRPAPPPARATWRQQAGTNLLSLGRIAVGDPSPSPPSCSPDGRFALAFAGELHNEDELRAELARTGTPSTGDLVRDLLAALGERALPLLNGAWALAWFDRQQGSLWLARDHLGLEPLYLHQSDHGLFFASEIKAILAGSGARFAVDATAASRFLEQTLLDSQPSTMFAGIDSLPAGHLLRIELDVASAAPELPRVPAAAPFWRLPPRDGFAGSTAERVAAVRELIEDSVRRRLQGNAVGALLSGGVDSSAVAAVAVAARPSLPLVCGVSTDARHRDSLLDAMCAHLRRDGHRVPLGIDAAQALPELQQAIARNDEPVRSFITVTEHRLKQAARALGLDALLSGLGADELFAGNLVHMVFHVQSLLASGHWLQAARAVAGALLRRTIRPRFRARVQKRYFPVLDLDRHPVRGPALLGDGFRLDVGLGARSAHERLLADLTQLSLPSLLHVDHRSSRAFGVATRLPYLDHRLVSLVAPMAPAHKLQRGYTKWLLRAAMAPHLPAAVAWRKVKQGRTDAYSEWLKHDLHAPIAALLAGELASASLGLVDADGLRARYAAFCAQRPDAGRISAQDIFNPLALELWARSFDSSLRAP